MKASFGNLELLRERYSLQGAPKEQKQLTPPTFQRRTESWFPAWPQGEPPQQLDVDLAHWPFAQVYLPLPLCQHLLVFLSVPSSWGGVLRAAATQAPPASTKLCRCSL